MLVSKAAAKAGLPNVVPSLIGANCKHFKLAISIHSRC